MSRSISHQPDFFLILTLTLLILVGLLMLFTASSWISLEKTSKGERSATYYLFHQLLYGLLPGIAFAYFFSRFSLNFLKKIAPFFLILSIILLLLIFVPGLRFESGGAASWIDIGNFTFQPSEFAKLALVVYLAAFFEKKFKEKKIKLFKESFLPFLIILSPFVILLFLQPDLGTLGILSLSALLIFFAAGGSFFQVLISVLLGVLMLAIGVFSFSHAGERVLTFFDRNDDTLGKSYQINQSLIAFGSGGAFGVGLGNGIQKYNYLPQPMGDTIFAVWGEETGFFGSLIVVSLFFMLAYRGIIISKNAPDIFSKILAIGIVIWIEVQAFLNIMAVIGLIPFTGLPLPFISYGGSSLISVLTSAGILINISRRTI